MANRFTTLLSNTKTRTMVLLVFGILVFGVVIAVSQTETKSSPGPTAQNASVTTGVPNQVKSTPGSEVTKNYQELQEKANIRGAQEAAKKGTTFIPTLTGNAQGYSNEDLQKQLSAAFDTLGGKCTKEKVAELTKAGKTTTEAIMELKSYGCSAAAIAGLFSPDQIAAALLAEKECGVGAAGCSAETVKQLKDQGSTYTQITAALKKNGCAVADIAKALKASGASATEIATALKANGSDAVEVATALAKAGFSKADILPALTQSGFASPDIAKALSSLNLEQADAATLTAQQQAQAAAAQRLAAQQEAQQLAAYSQQRQGKVQDLITAMDNQRKNIMDNWTQTPTQAYQEGDWAKQRSGPTTVSNSSKKSGSGSSSKDGSDQKGKVILKAGSILFAVLDTAVNSDEPGPVMATIVAGSLKGAKLLGSMTASQTSETISLNFTAINMPGEANSMGISAVAIDPDTARTALASDVDHHYLYRWGSLFASSFVQGYASAVASSGATSTTSQGAAGTVTTTSTPAMNAKQQLWSGIAAVGTKWSQVVGQNFDRPITISIDQGTGIGVLVTSDLTYGTNPIFYTPPTTSTASNSASQSPAAGAGTIPAGAGAAPTPSGISNEQRQALMNLLQSQPATAPTAGVTPLPGSTVVTTTGGS